MARSKKKTKSQKAPGGPSGSEREQPPPGMPPENSIQKVMDFVSPQNVHYKILRTDEMDAYDPVPKPKNPKPKKKKQSRRRGESAA